MKLIDESELTEDPVISTQKYFVLSYLLPPPGQPGVPMIKVRGSYRDIDGCKERIETLKKFDDNMFNIYIAEVGAWGGLYEPSKVLSDPNVEAVYDDSNESGDVMNKMMKGYKDNAKKAAKVFADRKAKLMDGTLLDEEYTTHEEKLLGIESRLKSITLEKEELEAVYSKMKTGTPRELDVIQETLECDPFLGSSSRK